MADQALKLVQAIGSEAALAMFAERLAAWLVADLNQSEEQVPDFTESRAKALLRATGVVDDPTLNDLTRLLESKEGQRVALYDLLGESELAENDEVRALATVSASAAGANARPQGWLSLAVAAFARQREYPLYQLDPTLPPDRYSPAGQIVARAGQWVRQQVQRSATDRNKLAQQLAAPPNQGTPTLDQMANEGPIAPLPPYFRPPVPVRYPEISRDTVRVDPEQQSTPPVVRGEPLVIRAEDLRPERREQSPPFEPASEPAAEEAPTPPRRMPPITITPDQVAPPNPPSPLPPSGVIMPAASHGASADSRSGLTVGLRQMFRSEELKSTKLRVVVQEYPDGPGLYGLQVQVRCKGIRAHVAGTTNREGEFIAELPVRLTEGLTYNVDITWPRDMGSDTERKSITLNADRTEFTLPFYRTHNSSDSA